jgi:cytochrome c2
LTPGQVIQITIQDARLKGDPFAGERLFTGAVQSKNTGCQICHSLEPGVVLVGPSLAGVASRAAARVPGMIAEDYLRQSIVEPDTFIVPDFPAGQMVPTYLQILSKEEIDDLVAFLLTLK